MKKIGGVLNVFDSIRKKFVVVQPEEWVRQHCLRFLIDIKNYPSSLISVEKTISVNRLHKRYDIVCYQPNGRVLLIVECKAPNVVINQAAFDQIARYNLSLNAQYLMLTNGLNHYYCRMDNERERYVFLKDLPAYPKTK